MKVMQIVHNPTAGNASHNRNTITELASREAEVVHYVSTEEEDWERFYRNKKDILMVAGGDGTIHKSAKVLLKNKIPNRKVPLRLIPLGTANNIATTLGINGRSSMKKATKKHFDCGQVSGGGADEFFLESVGAGIFPALIQEMKNNPIDNQDPPKKLNKTLEVLLQIVKDFSAKKAKIKLDGFTIKGKFLLVEVMNINFIGPNLKLAPNADPGDGRFDLVMIPERNRKALVSFLERMIKGKATDMELHSFTHTLRGEKIKLKWEGDQVHIDDDQVTEYSGEKLNIKILPGALSFYVH